MNGALPQKTNIPIVLASSGTPVTIYGGAAAAVAVVATFALKGGTVAPSSRLEFSGLCNFYLPNNAGRVVQIYIGATVVGQSFPVASQGGLHFKHVLFVSPSAKSLYAFGTNINDILAPTAGQGLLFTAHVNTKTTFAVDLTVDQTVQIRMQPVNGDTAELTAWDLVNYAAEPLPSKSFAPAGATSGWGDSLTAGTGATTSGGFVTLLRISDVGRPVTNMGVGSETSLQITNRVLADKVMGRFWNMILWMGRNDVGTVDLAALVLAQIARVVAYRGGTQKLILHTVTPANNEPTGGVLGDSIAACNVALKAAYPGIVVDISAVIPTNADGTFQAAYYSSATVGEVHLSEAAYVLIAAADKAKLAALGI